MNQFITKLLQRKELFVLFMMLEMLHFSIWFDFGSLISRSFMLSHLGLFLIWQPVWHGDEKLSFENIILFIVFTLIFTTTLNQWLLFAWLVLLIGFISGRVTLNSNERLIYILALGYIVIQLLFACIPSLANIEIENQIVCLSFILFLPLFCLKGKQFFLGIFLNEKLMYKKRRLKLVTKF